MSACPLCRSRKPSRDCPAKGAAICPRCCGSLRIVEIDCPADCHWLGGGASAAWEGRETEKRRDARRLAPHLARLPEGAHGLLFVTLTSLGGLRQGDLDDYALLEAFAALRKTAETLQSGVLYEQRSEDPRAQVVIDTLRPLHQAALEQEKARPADVVALLRALESSAREAIAEGKSATTLVETLRRIHQEIQVRELQRASSPRIVRP